MTALVIDSSVVVAMLVVQRDRAGEWAEQTLLSASLAAPHLLYAEVANQLRRFTFNGLFSEDAASLAYAQLLEMPIDLFPFEPVAARVWELRKNITAYDAWYVALAELLHAPLATLDLRLTRATGPTCSFVTPSAGGETVLVTDRDRVVAELVPPREGRSPWLADAAPAEAVRMGWLTPPQLRELGPPPRIPVAPTEQLLAELARDRGDR